MTKIKETKAFLTMHKLLEYAILDYEMIQEGDKIVVAMSGGKDSSILLRFLARKKIFVTNDYEIYAVFVKQGFSNDDEKIEFLTKYCQDLEVPFKIIEEPLEQYTKTRKEKPCYICSRTRRMAIFNFADEINASKVALGHHKDDFIETFILNLFYSHEISTMKPFNPFFGGKKYLIRPMVYIDEKAIITETKEIPSFSSGCPFDKISQRLFVKEMLDKFYKQHKLAKKNIFRALYTPNNEYLLKKPSKKV